MEDNVYTEGIQGDSVVILKNGQPITIQAILMKLNSLERIEESVCEAYEKHEASGDEEAAFTDIGEFVSSELGYS